MEVTFQMRHGSKNKLSTGAIVVSGVIQAQFARVEGLADAWVNIAKHGLIGWQRSFEVVRSKLNIQEYAALVVLLILKTQNEIFQQEALQAALNVAWEDVAPKYRMLFRETLTINVTERAIDTVSFATLCATLRVLTKAKTLQQALEVAKCTNVFQSESEGACDRVCVCGPGGTLTQTVLLQRLLPWEDEVTVSS